MGSCSSTSSERNASKEVFYTTGAAVSETRASKKLPPPDESSSSTEATTRGRGSTISTRSITEEVRISISRNGTIQEFLVALHDDASNIRNFYSGIDSESRSSILGKGNWGTVKIVNRKRDGQKFACKQLILTDSMPKAQFEELKSEIDSLSRLDHPQLARLYEAFEEPGKKLYLVMELLTGGELFTRLVEDAPNGRFTEARSATLAKRMVSALAYLHGQGIVHRDLKLENFVFRDRDPESDKLVLIDFGLAKRFGASPSIRMVNQSLNSSRDDPTNTSIDEGNEPMEIMHSVVGSSYYIAPEVLDGRYSGPSCDMWSLGVIVYMMLCGKAPFNGKTEASIMKRAQIGEYTMEGAVWDGVSKEAKNFVTSCLCKSVPNRITAANALKHPWIQKAVLSNSGTSKSKSGSSRISKRAESSPPLPKSIIRNLMNFSEDSELIRIGRQALAFTFSRNDVVEQTDCFEKLDGDGDGYLTLDDLKTGFRSADLVGDEEYLDQNISNLNERIDDAANRAFAAMDFEGLDLVRFSVFMSASVGTEKVTRDVPLMKEAFQKLDQGHKGYIGISDLVRLRFSDMHARDIIDRFLNDIGMESPTDDKARRIEFRDFLIAMRRRNSKSDLRNPSKKKSPSI